jgi:hypothetical protein
MTVTSIDPHEVPNSLRDLIPIAEKRAIRQNRLRDDWLDSGPINELKELVDTVGPRRAEIDDWLDSMPKDMEKWPKAAVDFLYLIKTWHEAACEVFARQKHGRGTGG